MLSVANLRLLSKLCFLQRKCDSLSKSSCLHRISIRCSEVAFAAKIMVPAAKHFLLPNYAADSEPIFVAEVCNLQRTSFRCRTVRPAANQFSLLNCVASSKLVSLPIFYNRPPGINDLNACNNFIV